MLLNNTSSSRTQLSNSLASTSSSSSRPHHNAALSPLLHATQRKATAVAAAAGPHTQPCSSSRSCVQHAPLINSNHNSLSASTTCSRSFSRIIAAAAAASGDASPHDANTNTSSDPQPADAAAAATGSEGSPAAAADSLPSSSTPPYSDEPGPAFRDTLAMLEWQRLCEHLARFSSTSVGKRLCLKLSVPLQEATSLRLQQEVSAVFALENTFTNLLDFGGINSNDAEGAIKRADKGGMVSAKQLRGLVTLLEGAHRLKKQIALVAQQNRVTGRDSPLRPLLDAMAAVSVPRALMNSITSAIQEDGELSDNASEQVRTTRARVRQLTGRINNMLKGYPGEASERGGRLCIAAPAGTKIANGVLLGTSVGGGMVFIEPGQVVSLNNELMSARAEALSAEESVLWDLSARLMGVLDDVTLAFDTVGWLDLTAAKVRFGLWLGGIMPTFTPWDQVFERRPAGAPFGAPLPPVTPGGASPAAVSLQGLSHPLLLADYKVKRQRLEHQAAMMSNNNSNNAAAGGSSGKKGAGRLLGTRREVMAKRLSSADAAALLSGLDDDSNKQKQGGDGDDLTPAEQLARLTPPRPIDITIQPETAVVVITGPNTGGKTATMKALGLAACMAKNGMLLPAAAPARLPCFSAVLADIGDEQSLTANLSTFSGHITRISAVRGEADGWSLLLLDELGTGTDPTEGAALGQALLKTLVRGGPSNGALTIATTHHSIMTGLKFDDGRVENASVEFDEEKLAPTYKLLWGVPGRSNALNIAARLGLSPSIIAAARQRLAVGVAAANAAIEELEAVQEEARQADMLLFAVNANVEETKERVRAAKALNLQKQRELALKRVAAIQEVLEAARPVVKALKEERKVLKRGNNQTRITRHLDTALGEPAFQRASSKTLESALEAFENLTASSSSSSSTAATAAAAAAAQQQQQQQQLFAAEPWIKTWNQLLTRARATLVSTVLLGGGAAEGGGVTSDTGSSGSSSSGSDAAAAAAAAADELEAEIEAVRLKAAAQAAAKAEQARAAQQLLDEHFGIIAQQEAKMQSAAAAAGKKKKSIEEQIEQEAFVEGVRVIEEALDADAELWAGLEQQQQQLAAQAAVEQQQRQQEAAAAAAEMAQLEQQLEQQFEELELEWYTAAAAAAEAAEREASEQQRAAQAARQQQEQQRQQKMAADLEFIKAVEDIGWDDLGQLDFDSVLSQGASSGVDLGSSSSSLSGLPLPPTSSSSSNGHRNQPPGHQQQQQHQRDPAPPLDAAAHQSSMHLFEEMMQLDLGNGGGASSLAIGQQQQRQQQPGGGGGGGGKKRKQKKGNSVIKFRKG